MTTKQYLRQIERYEEMIRNKELEIRRCIDMGTSSTVPTDKEKIQTSGTTDLVGRCATEMVALSDEIKMLSAKRTAIIKQIDSMENNDFYRVLTYRYVQHMSIFDIMDAMELSKSWTYKMIRSAHNAFEEKYGYIYRRNDTNPEQKTSRNI